MSTKPKILVTSAAGKTGLAVSMQLMEQSIPVRAFVRRSDARSRALASAGAVVFQGDQYSITDMRRAMMGVQRAYQCAPTAPNGLHFNAVFTAAAHEAGLEHVVTLASGFQQQTIRRCSREKSTSLTCSRAFLLR